MLSPSPNRLKQTFSKGPAHKTRSSTAQTLTSKSAPTVPPDPGELHYLSTPSNRPSSSSSFNQPSTSFNNPYPSNDQPSSSPTFNHPSPIKKTIHSSPSSPSKSPHHSNNNRFSAFEEPSTSDQLDNMDEHIHHVECNSQPNTFLLMNNFFLFWLQTTFSFFGIHATFSCFAYKQLFSIFHTSISFIFNLVNHEHTI
jgi:hypothetical protein